jgi:hypothetical protein
MPGTPNDGLLKLLERALAEFPFASRRMFGGIGLYLDGRFFGIIDSGRMYFRTDEEEPPGVCQRRFAAAAAETSPARPADGRPQLRGARRDRGRSRRAPHLGAPRRGGRLIASLTDIARAPLVSTRACR